MKRVTGIGGVFFKTPNPEATREWYKKHLGLEVDAYGTTFAWKSEDNPTGEGFTAWSPFKEDTDYFGNQPFMINYRVHDLEWLIEELKKEGVEIVSELQVETYGKFIHVLDLNGLRLELWEPNDEVYNEMIGAKTN